MDCVTDILFAMRIRGAKIWTADGQLFYEAPPGALGRADVETLRARKAEIVGFLEQSRAPVPAEPPLGPRRHTEPVPLTLTQSYMFNKVAASGFRSIRRPTVLMRLSGALDLGAMERALNELVLRHEILRTRLVMRDGVPMQEVAAPQPFPLECIDLSDGTPAARETRAKLTVRQIASEPIDVMHDALFLARLLVLGELDHVLLIAMDHLLFDAPSMEILQKDICALYDRQTHRRLAPLPPVAVQFPDYADWQQKVRRSRIDIHDAWWDERLAGAGHVRIFEDEGRYSPEPTAARLRFRFDRSLNDTLRTFGVKHRTTLMMTLLTAYIAFLSRWCRTNDLVVPIPSIGRRHRELEHTVGPLGTALYLRVEVRDGDSFLDLLSRVADAFGSAYEHDDSGKRLAQMPRPPYASNPGFNFVANPGLDGSFAGDAGTGAIRSAHFPVSLSFGDETARVLEEPQLFIVDRHGELTGSFGYRSDRIRVTTLKRFEQSLQGFVQAVMNEPGARLPRL